ncbi:IS3 family transposase [Scrofimicrobium canadense]|uniref:IS3 family transposase n=1 Tax=Scrofimicrobium canadense TaxID=2652290 RepID=UPI00197CEEA6|nr:IS3 family transposase [Scrofimicrobium canadense]
MRDSELIPVLREVHARNYGVYGKRKMWHAMRREGWDIGREQTGRLMRKAGLCGIRRGRKPITTCRSKAVDTRPDLVDRDFTAVGPNRLWVADITYVRTTWILLVVATLRIQELWWLNGSTVMSRSRRF